MTAGDAPQAKAPGRGGPEGGRSGCVAQAHRRLEHLYEISKLLTRFDRLETTVPAVIAVVTQTLPLRTAIFILETGGHPRTIVWHADGVSAYLLRTAQTHARNSYAYLAGSAAAGAVVLNDRQTETSRIDEDAAESVDRKNFIILPLAIEHRPIFGALQIEGADRLDEMDLVFVNAVVNQLAVALDRQGTIEAKQAATEARRHEAEALRERYEALVDNIDHAFVWEADARTFQLSYMSARAETLLGYPRHRWLGARDFWNSCIYPEDRDALAQTLREVLSEKKDRRCDHRCLTADGRVLWFNTGVHLAQADTPTPQLQGVSLDITLAKEAEEKIRGQLDFTRAVTGSLAEGVLAVDLDGRITLFNASAAQMLGWKEEEVLGKLVQEIVQIQRADGTAITAEESPFDLVMRRRDSFQSEEHLFSRRGQAAFPVSCTAAALRQGDRISGAVLAFRDVTERKQAQEALRASEERYRTLFDSAPMAVFVCDRNAVIQAYNRRAVELWGREPECGIERHCGSSKLFLPDGSPLPHGRSPIVEVLRTGMPATNVEVFIERPDGSRIPVIVNFAALKSPGGEISGAITSFIDITERKQAEGALREAAERFRFLAESMPQKIFTAKPNGDLDYFNQQWTQFTGLPLEQIKDWGWTQFIHPEDLEENVRGWRHSIDTGEPLQLEHRFRRADGVYRWHLSRTHAMRSAGGNRVMWIGSSTDIDDQKHAEKEQRLLAEISAQLISSPGYRDTLHGIARFSVPLLADLCVIDEVELSGNVRKLEVVFADEGKQRDFADLARRFAPQPGWRTPQARVLESGKSFFLADVSEADLENIAQDEEHAQFIRAVEVKSMMIVPLVARGKTLGAITFVMAESNRHYSSSDVLLGQEIAHLGALAVDNARLYEQAQRATRAREDLLAVVSHDLRNPLGVILMSTAQMGRASRGGDGSKSRKLIEKIKRSAERMSHLIQDLLDTASIDTGKLSIVRRRLAVGTLAADMIESMQPLAASKSLHLKSELPADLPAIFADADRLQQVFANLLSNAIKFTPAGGTITVRAEEAGQAVQCSVADTGSGISEEDLPHLFERFWQASRTARQGTGLGLSIVRGIVETHGGRVWVESQVGVGSTFFFTLPVGRDTNEPAHDKNAQERNNTAGQAGAASPRGSRGPGPLQ